MDQLDVKHQRSAESLLAEVDRLHAELEQMRVQAEDGEQRVDALVIERDTLLEELRHRGRGQRKAAGVIEDLTERLNAADASLQSLDAEQTGRNTAEEELRVTIEELQVLAEELEEANEALLLSNAELDRRVAERTAELAEANLALALVNADLNDRVRIEVAAREEAQAKLFQQQKLEALGQLTGGVAHDFNNLLTVVMSGLHMLARAETPERRAQLMARIEEAVGRGADLTRRLLAFGRRQALRPEPVDLTARMSDLCEFLAHSLRADLTVQPEVEDGAWPVEVDYGALELALLNLAVNARDAMPHGGIVTLAARNLRLDRKQATTLRLAPGEYVELSVIDRGTGMDPEVMERVFEPFFTTKEIGKGSGLGLAQVFGFAQQSGGTARADSEQGEGTTVSIILPRCLREPEAPAAPAPREPSATARSAAILVVEDDDEVAALVMDLLAQFGHAPTRVSNADAALGALNNGRHLDLLFTDVLLPGGTNGVALAHEVSRRRPELPIVLTSGYGGDVIGEMGTVRWPVLRKPYEPETLRAVLQGALHH